MVFVQIANKPDITIKSVFFVMVIFSWDTEGLKDLLIKGAGLLAEEVSVSRQGEDQIGVVGDG